MAQPSILLENQKTAYQMLAKGGVSICPIQTLGQKPLEALLAGPDAQLCVKTGYVKDDDVFVMKVAGGGSQFSGNTGMVQVYDQKTLKMQYLLQDEGLLTEIRTAAAACLATSLFMPKHVDCIGILGGSVQAIWQLRLLGCIIPREVCRKVIVKTRSKKSALAFIEKMKTSSSGLDREWEIIAADEIEGQGFAGCQIIHGCTCARSPVLTLDDIQGHQGLHISAIGADSPGKQELRSDLVRGADVLVCDSLTQTKERGEFQHLLREDPAAISRIKELGQLLMEGEPMEFRQGPEDRRLSIFDSSGVAVQDLCIAKLVGEMVQRLTSTK